MPLLLPALPMLLLGCPKSQWEYEWFVNSPNNESVIITRMVVAEYERRPAVSVSLYPTIEGWSPDRSRGETILETQGCTPLYVFWRGDDAIVIVLHPFEAACRGLARPRFSVGDIDVEITRPESTRKDLLMRGDEKPR